MKLIDEQRLAELLIAERCLLHLERNGVVEWDGYDEALDEPLSGDNMTYWEYASTPTRELIKDFNEA